MKTTLVKAFERGGKFGGMGFHENPHFRNIHKRTTQQLWDIYRIVATEMAVSRFYGRVDVEVENGEHAGTTMSVTMTEPVIKAP